MKKPTVPFPSLGNPFGRPIEDGNDPTQPFRQVPTRTDNRSKTSPVGGTHSHEISAERLMHTAYARLGRPRPPLRRQTQVRSPLSTTALALSRRPMPGTAFLA